MIANVCPLFNDRSVNVTWRYFFLNNRPRLTKGLIMGGWIY